MASDKHAGPSRRRYSPDRASRTASINVRGQMSVRKLDVVAPDYALVDFQSSLGLVQVHFSLAD